MFAYRELRLIKPIGSVDDWESGFGYDDSAVKKGKVIKQAIWDILTKLSPLSAADIHKYTGASKGSIQRYLTSLHSDKLIALHRVQVNPSQRPTHFYTKVA